MNWTQAGTLALIVTVAYIGLVLVARDQAKDDGEQDEHGF